jgi:hypothetical protein
MPESITISPTLVKTSAHTATPARVATPINDCGIPMKIVKAMPVMSTALAIPIRIFPAVSKFLLWPTGCAAGDGFSSMEELDVSFI